MKQTTQTLLILNMFLFLSCAEQVSQKDLSSAEIIEQRRVTDLNGYFSGLADWLALSPEKMDQKIKVRESKSVQVNNSICTTQEFDLTKTPDKIVMQNPAAGILYPGALIQGDGYLQGPGGLRELPIRKRAPVVIATDLANENNAIRIDKVDYAGYQEAYAALLKAAALKNLTKPANVSFTQSEASSSEQAALDLGFSVKYMGSSLSGNMQSKNSTKENVFMAVFEQRAFTVSAVAPATPSGFFSADFSDADLKTQVSLGNVSEKNPPLYVSSVSYGRMLIFTVTSKAQKEDIQGALNGSYNQGLMEVDAKVKAKYQKIMNESTIKVISFGGDPEQAIALIKSGNMNKYFTKSPSLESFVPLSYVLRNIKDNSIAKVSETTKYNTEECTPLPPKSWKTKITIKKILMHYTGASSRGEIYGKLFLNKFEIWSRTRNEYESTNNDSLLQAGSLQKSIIVDLPLSKPRPVTLTAQFLDNDDYNSDDVLAIFNEDIGYTVDKTDVLPSGTYTTTSHRNVEITYEIERIKAIY